MGVKSSVLFPGIVPWVRRNGLVPAVTVSDGLSFCHVSNVHERFDAVLCTRPVTLEWAEIK